MLEDKNMINPQGDRPSQLRFSSIDGHHLCGADHLMTLVTLLEEDEDRLSRYKMEIVDRDDVKVWIKMTQDKRDCPLNAESRFNKILQPRRGYDGT
jgi:hypothetical protein